MKFLPRNRWRRALLLALVVCCVAELVAFLTCRWFDQRYPRDQYEVVVSFSPLRNGLGPAIPSKYDYRAELGRRLTEGGFRITSFEPFRDSGHYRIIIMTEDGKATALVVDGMISDLGTISYYEEILPFAKQARADLEAEANDPRLPLKIREGCAIALDSEKRRPNCGGSLVQKWDSSYKALDSFSALHRRAFGWLESWFPRIST